MSIEKSSIYNARDIFSLSHWNESHIFESIWKINECVRFKSRIGSWTVTNMETMIFVKKFQWKATKTNRSQEPNLSTSASDVSSLVTIIPKVELHKLSQCKEIDSILFVHKMEEIKFCIKIKKNYFPIKWFRWVAIINEEKR